MSDCRVSMTFAVLGLLTSPVASLLAGGATRPAVRPSVTRVSPLKLDEAVAVPKTFLEGHKHHLKDLSEYEAMYEKSVSDPAAFWGDIADTFHWEAKWDSVVRSNFAKSKGKVETAWFEGGTTNICYNCLDRHVAAGKGEQTCFYHEANGIDEDMKDWTYAEVLDEVQRVANVLKDSGVKRGDCVTLFMPMIPQLPIAMLACARIGAVHSVVFGGFSAEALAGRMIDAKSTVVLTANGVMRGAKPIDLFAIVQKATTLCSAADADVTTCVVLQRLDTEVELQAGRDVYWHDVVPKASNECAVEWMEAEDPLFVLYTSGSTGKPKGVQHTTGGYMVYAATTSKYIFDLQDGDTFFCTADCGWITGHSYVAYGPLLNGASQLIFEGVPSFPDAGRLWDIVDKYSVTQLYTAPTAIRALMGAGNDFVTKYDRKSLKLLGSVGEPINPEAWRWYYDVVGEGRCPIVDTWWQTETGGIMITPLPADGWGMKPGSATRPFFGVQPVLITPEGVEMEGEAEGLLAIKAPWPSTIRDVLGDYERKVSTYFPIEGPNGEGYYLTGDGARRDADGYYWITGRVDDVINTSGHRIGTAEVESALVLHPKVSEAAVVGFPHPVKGEGIYTYVTLNAGVEATDELRKELVMQCRSEIGAFAAPDAIHWAPALPKTRSGKIMRRILRKIAAAGKEVTDEELGDTSTLADTSVVAQLIDAYGK